MSEYKFRREGTRGGKGKGLKEGVAYVFVCYRSEIDDAGEESLWEEWLSH